MYNHVHTTVVAFRGSRNKSMNEDESGVRPVELVAHGPQKFMVPADSYIQEGLLLRKTKAAPTRPIVVQLILCWVQVSSTSKHTIPHK